MTTVVMTTVLIALVGLVVIFNLCVWAEVEKSREKNTPFFMKWKEEVNGNHDLFIGKIFMRSFYFIPTIIAVISWCKSKLKLILTKSRS